MGLIRKYRLLDSKAFLHASLGRNSVRPWGLAGGQPGSNNYVDVHRDGEVMRCARIAYHPLQRGDVIRIITGRGGGYGDARSRPHGLVSSDVRNGYLSHEQARSDYEVVLREDFSIDEAATDALGASRRAR